MVGECSEKSLFLMSKSSELKYSVTGEVFNTKKRNNMAEHKQIKKTNKHQFDKLVELMEAYPDMAKGVGAFGSSKKNQKEYWDSLAVELNCLGPPARIGKEWHKVWLDYKNKLKKKISSNKGEVVATGGGPYAQLSMSPLETAMDELLGLQHAVNSDGDVFGGCVYIQQSPEQHSCSNTPVKTRRSSKLPTESVSMLETHSAVLAVLKKMENSLSQIARYTRKGYELKKENIKAQALQKFEAGVKKNGNKISPI